MILAKVCVTDLNDDLTCCLQLDGSYQEHVLQASFYSVNSLNEVISYLVLFNIRNILFSH
jgi:hypothetical protein